VRRGGRAVAHRRRGLAPTPLRGPRSRCNRLCAGRMTLPARETPLMPSRQLHASLHAFATEVRAALAEAVAGGDEIGFEVVEAGARGSRKGLYCYAPLTGEFIERHWEALLELSS